MAIATVGLVVKEEERNAISFESDIEKVSEEGVQVEPPPLPSVRPALPNPNGKENKKLVMSTRMIDFPIKR